VQVRVLLGDPDSPEVAAQAPVLHLRQISGGTMVTTYLDSFERVWSEARPID
jgi:hypothetical protein